MDGSDVPELDMTPNLEDESLSSPSRRCVYLSNPASCELLFYKGYQWDLDLLRPENGMTDFLGTLTGSSNHRAEGTEELHTPSRTRRVGEAWLPVTGEAGMAMMPCSWPVRAGRATAGRATAGRATAGRSRRSGPVHCGPSICIGPL